MTATARDEDATDEELAAAVARRGESDRALAAARVAFERLYGRHARPLLAFLAARVPRAGRDDLHQEVWRRIWQHLPDGFRGGRFRAWLFQVARNALIDESRRCRPGPLGEDVPLADHRQGRPEERLVEEERMRALRHCLDRLDAESAALIRARLGGEDYAAICARLGLKPARAHKMFHAAKARLQACIERALS